MSDEVLTDLKARLTNTRYIDSLKGTNFEYGFRGEVLKKVVDHWLNKYDWRKQEKELNKFDHFKTQIEGLDVHYMHVKPKNVGKNVRVYPLLIVHGWPGSVVEFLKIIPLLTTPTDGIAFEVVAPSIPGYGWSQAAQKPGFNVIHAARVFNKLMTRLGYDKFYYQGGDWGAIIGKAVAVLAPDRVLGFSTTMPVMSKNLKNIFKVINYTMKLMKLLIT